MSTSKYNTAKIWQLICFPFNNTATNVMFMLMTYVSYLAVGGYGIGVVLVSTIVTATRIFDGITDPIIGFIIDKTGGKFGKFRPMMALGYIIMLIAIILMYFVAIGSNAVIFTLIYALYIIGYTFQTACTKSAQVCLTNDPKQRPIFTRCDSIYNLILFSVIPVYVSNYLIPKYSEISIPALQEFAITALVSSFILTFLAIIALKGKDVPENWANSSDKKVKFKDYLSILKNNRAIQMLMVAAATDKIASQAINSSVTILVFGVIMQNYAFYGKMSIITMIPSIIIILFGTEIARKRGSKKTLVDFTFYSIIFAGILFAIFAFCNPTRIGFDSGDSLTLTIVFIVIYCIFNGVKNISGGIVIPMIADCSDYQTYLSGKSVPGMMGTLFSFLDKIVSSLGTTITGLFIATIGYKDVLPQPTDAMTDGVFGITMFLYLGLPILGWIISLIAMKFYPLTNEKMEEIQDILK